MSPAWLNLLPSAFVAVSGDSGASDALSAGGASISGMRCVRAAMMRLFSLSHSLACASCSRSVAKVSSSFSKLYSVFVGIPAFSGERSSGKYGSFSLRDYRPSCRQHDGVAVAVCLLVA